MLAPPSLIIGRAVTPLGQADEPRGQHSRSLSGMSALSGTAPLPPSPVSASLLKAYSPARRVGRRVDMEKPQHD